MFASRSTMSISIRNFKICIISPDNISGFVMIYNSDKSPSIMLNMSFNFNDNVSSSILFAGRFVLSCLEFFAYDVISK